MEIAGMFVIARTAQSADRTNIDFTGEWRRRRMGRTLRMLVPPGNCDYDQAHASSGVIVVWLLMH
jgi:hypothetical protein